MPPAARVADPTTHGAPLAPGPGSMNVMIGGQPAWRAMIDQHACPAVSVSGADGVGSVIVGSPTVLINGQMACRQLDIVVEKPGLAMGPANPIIMGFPTVMIGDTATPFPFKLVGTPAEITQILVALAWLYSTPSGKALFASIAASGHTVTIQITSGGSNDAPGVAPGTKSDTTVSWNPTQNLPGLPPGDPRSGAVVLGHELCHANHAANGTSANGPDDHDPAQSGTSTSARGEERQTVGSKPPYDAAGNPVNDSAGNPAGTHVRQPDGTFAPGPDYTSGPPTGQPTENSIRNDLGFPQRQTYYGPSWPGGPPW